MSDAALGSVADHVRRKLGLTPSVFARLAGVSTRQEHGDPETDLRRVREAERFVDRLAEIVPAASIPAWLEKPNAAFGNLTPLEVVERGEVDRLWTMIFYLESGVPI